MVKIKFEVDTQPPLDLESEKKRLLIPSLFAGKIHAILCRNWSKKSNLKTDLVKYDVKKQSVLTL